MKKIFALAAIAIVCGLLGYLYYTNQSVTEYYMVSERPASWYDSKVKIEVKKVKDYESDSLAIERETELYHTLQDMHNDKVIEAKKNGNTSNEMIFTRMRDEQCCLIKIVHKRNLDFGELKQLIIKNGINSAAVDNYCEKNNAELSLFPILSNY